MAQMLQRHSPHSVWKCPGLSGLHLRANALGLTCRKTARLAKRRLRGNHTLVRDQAPKSSPSSSASGDNANPRTESPAAKVGTDTSGSVFSSGKGPGGDNDDEMELDPLNLATATSVIEKISGALITYGLAVLLGNLSGVEPTQELLWKDGAPLAVGAFAAAPFVLAAAVLFLPSPTLGWSLEELEIISEVDKEEAESPVFALGTGLLEQSESTGQEVKMAAKSDTPAIPRPAFEKGLWLYQMHVLKPWFPAFEWSAVGLLFLISCASAGAQELLVRGYGGALLEGWYASILAGTNDVYNPIYWGKVFKLVTPDTARWLAAFSIIVLQVSLSAGTADRAARFTRLVMSRLPDRITPSPLVREVMLQGVKMSIKDDLTTETQSEVQLEAYTAEERVVYWLSMGLSVLLVGATNCAWAASGSLVGSYTAQVLIDGAATGLQQWKATQLPERDLWKELRRKLDEEDEDEDEDEEDDDDEGASDDEGGEGQGSDGKRTDNRQPSSEDYQRVLRVLLGLPAEGLPAEVAAEVAPEVVKFSESSRKTEHKGGEAPGKDGPDRGVGDSQQEPQQPRR